MKNNIVFTFVIPTLTGGGAEREVSVLASELAEMGYDVHIIVYYKTQKEYPVSDKVDVYYDAHIDDPPNNFLNKIKKLKRVRKLIKSWDTSYVIPFLNSSIIHTYIATRFTKVRFISTIMVYPKLRSSKWNGVCDYITTRADALFAQTEEEKQYYSKKVQQKTFVLPNPVSSKMLETQHEYRKTMRKIIAVGRLREQKNYPLLINAVGILKEEFEDIKAEIWGDGPQKEELLQLVEEKGLAGNVAFKGSTSDIATEYNQSDFFVMSSIYEGMPNALMEALAVGLPCISTDCPSGPAELIATQETGLLVPMNDAQNLANAIKDLILNPEKAERLGRAAKRDMQEKYAPGIIAEKFAAECQKY